MRLMVIVKLLLILMVSYAPLVAYGQSKQPAPPVALTPEQQEQLRKMWNLPPGSKFKMEVKNSTGGSLKTKETGKGVGAAAETEGDKLNENFSGDAPATTLSGGGSARGGGATKATKADATKFPPVPWKNPLFWLGCLLIAGAGGLFLFKSKIPWVVPKDLPLVLGVAGIGLLAAAFYPPLLLWAFLGVAAFLIVPYIVAKMKQSKAEVQADDNAVEALRFKEVGRAVTAAVDDPLLSAAARAEVKARVAVHADPADVDTIDEIKREDQLGKYARS